MKLSFSKSSKPALLSMVVCTKIPGKFRYMQWLHQLQLEEHAGTSLTDPQMTRKSVSNTLLIKGDLKI